MTFPTATITQGSGLTINTLPNAGQATMANSLGVAIASDQSPVPTNAASGAFADGSIVALGAQADAAWSGTGSGTLNAVSKSIRALLAGIIGISATDGAINTLGSQADAAWSGTGSSTLNAALKAIYAKVAGIIGVSAASGAFVDGSIATIGTQADVAYSGSGSATLVAALKAIYAKVTTSASGSASINTDQIPVTTSNTQIVAARPGRIAVTIKNLTGTDKVSLGITGVGLTHGYVLMATAGDNVTIPTQAQVCASVQTTTQTVCFIETFN